MDLDYKKIGDHVRKYRERLEWTQAMLGEAAEVEGNTVSHIETGTTKVSLPTLIGIANALNVSLDALVYDSLCVNRHISVQILDEMISDCTDDELKLFVDMFQAVKQTLDHHQK